MWTIQSWTSAVGKRPLLRDDDHDPTKATFGKATQDLLPVLEILAARLGNAGEHTLLAVTSKANDEVDGGRSDAVAIPDLDVLAVHENGQHVRGDGAGVAQLHLLHELSRDGVEILLRDGQPEAAECRLGGADGAAGEQQAEQQRFHLLGKTTLVLWRQEAGPELAAPGARHAHLDRNAPDAHRTLVGPVALVARRAKKEGPPFRLPEGRQDQAEQLPEREPLQIAVGHALQVTNELVGHADGCYFSVWTGRHSTPP
jgi:hypothetical protein